MHAQAIAPVGRGKPLMIGWHAPPPTHLMLPTLSYDQVIRATGLTDEELKAVSVPMEGFRTKADERRYHAGEWRNGRWPAFQWIEDARRAGRIAQLREVVAEALDRLEQSATDDRGARLRRECREAWARALA